MSHEVSIRSIYDARRRLAGYLPATPLLRSRELSARISCELWVKYENRTPIRSFKARGGIYRLLTLPDAFAGVATASTGNHGQGIALGARVAGRRAVVFVPDGANPSKIDAIRAFGAELREAGGDLAAANAAAKQAANDEHLLYVEDGEDPALLIGCATLTLEILEQLPRFDDLVLPAGGANLAGAAALVLRHLAPEVRLTVVQSDAAPSVHSSWLAGESRWDNRCETFAGGLATSYPGHFAFDFLRSHLDRVQLVSDEALIESAVTMLETTGHLPEGAGAAALAGVLADPARYAGRTVVVLLSGSNVEPLIWRRLTGGSTATE